MLPRVIVYDTAPARSERGYTGECSSNGASEGPHRPIRAQWALRLGPKGEHQELDCMIVRQQRGVDA